MENKTCGECRFFVTNPGHGGCCTFICDAMCDDDRACDSFANPTNGDRIRHMSNEELAEFISVHTICSNCPARTDECLHNASKVCKKKWLKWLNAPAESERENE